jgi:hypothetical protein
MTFRNIVVVRNDYLCGDRKEIETTRKFVPLRSSAKQDFNVSSDDLKVIMRNGAVLGKSWAVV